MALLLLNTVVYAAHVLLTTTTTAHVQASRCAGSNYDRFRIQDVWPLPYTEHVMSPQSDDTTPMGTCIMPLAL